MVNPNPLAEDWRLLMVNPNPLPDQLTLQDTKNFVDPFVLYRKTANSNLQPILGAANRVRQVMLNAPFRWTWNRIEDTFDCVVGQQDYSVDNREFGWIENAEVLDNVSTPNKWWGMEVKLGLGHESEQALPQNIAVQKDDGAGGI